MMELPRSSHADIFRRSDERLIAGVCGGLANCLGVDPWVVRAGFVLMAFGSGAGVALYAVAYALSARPAAETPVELPTRRHAVGFLLISLGVFAAGVELFVDNIEQIFSLRAVWLAAIATALALTVLVGPWLLRLMNELNEERSDRIRSEERADISAHLHDSVLNTLALIQRSEAKPEVVMLARRQERELRAWMQGRLADEDAQLDSAIDAMASRIEGQYNISVDAVVVGGNLAVDERISALVAALQEATVNAARHADVAAVSVYVEVEPDQIVGFVRDQGVGFVRADVNEDRRGIVDSIEGRMRRIGGKAYIRSTPGEGTEVELQIDRGAK